MTEELWGKPKENAPPIITTAPPNPSPSQIPVERELEEEEGEEEEEEEEEDPNDPLTKFYREVVPGLDDDDLMFLLGNTIQELIHRSIDNSVANTGAIGAVISRLRRVEGAIQHLAAGSNHGLLIHEGHTLCRCGGLKIPAAVPEQEKFVWDAPRKPRPTEEQ